MARVTGFTDLALIHVINDVDIHEYGWPPWLLDREVGLKRLFAAIVTWLIALLGAFFTLAGCVLAALGGSVYYVIAGVVAAGGHGALGTRYGDYTLAFALPRGA